MSAGYVVGTGQIPDEELAVRVGGPLSSLHAEAAGLLELLTLLGAEQQALLLVFVDSLVLLDILQSWGRANFHPRPNDIVHFDVILPLLNVLRQWQYPVRLVKVKCHTGCLMNERADELAERCYDDGAQIVCPAPQKYRSIWLRVRPHVRAWLLSARSHFQEIVPPIGASSKRLWGLTRAVQSVCATQPLFGNCCTNLRGRRLRVW
jgi:hypothetical protein